MGEANVDGSAWWLELEKEEKLVIFRCLMPDCGSSLKPALVHHFLSCGKNCDVLNAKRMWRHRNNFYINDLLHTLRPDDELVSRISDNGADVSARLVSFPRSWPMRYRSRCPATAAGRNQTKRRIRDGPETRRRSWPSIYCSLP